jgi:hypothetical protein
MKKMKNKKLLSWIAAILLWPAADVFSQDEKPTPELVLGLHYYALYNQPPYVKVNTRVKLDRRTFKPAPGITVKVYLGEENNDRLMGQVITDTRGLGKIFIPATLKEVWDSADTHTFLAFAEAKKPYDAAEAELTITKARLTIDTLNEDDSRYVAIRLEEKQKGTWVPVKDAELKAAVKRLGGDLNIGEEETYTTDEAGEVKAEFQRDSLPGDPQGNIILIAKTEDHENYGNLSAETTVKWGAPFTYHSTFNERSLFATRDKAPGWLLFLAYLIIGIVWGTLIYIVILILKIRRLGRQPAQKEKTIPV